MSTLDIFYPKLLTALRNYSWRQFTQDLMAGIIVGIIAFPLAIAFGIASGVTPAQGLMTAIIAGFIISAFGGSRVLIGGPTGAFIVILYGIVAERGYEDLAIATFMAGAILIFLGLARLGSWIKFIPLPVIIGFTSGIALIIFSSQIKDFFGLQMASVPADFIEKLAAFHASKGTWSIHSAWMATLTIAIILMTPKIVPKIPGAFVALLFTTLLAWVFDVPVETIGSRFGTVELTFSVPALPSINFSKASELLSPAFSIALLCALESLLCAVVADGMIGGKHRPNTELIGQGIANMIVPFFGGIPATGAIARTAANVRNGGRTPIAGIIHALTLLAIILIASRLTSYIPLATLAGILVIVAYYMSEWREFVNIFSGPKADVAVLLVTFFATVLMDLVVAIQAGMILACFLFMKRMSEVSDIQKLQGEMAEKGDYDHAYDKNLLRSIPIPPNTDVYELQGAFFFGAAHKFELVFQQSLGRKKFIIFRMQKILTLDATSLHLLQKLSKSTAQSKSTLILTEINPHCEKQLIKSSVLDKMENTRIFNTLKNAIEYIQSHA